MKTDTIHINIASLVGNIVIVNTNTGDTAQQIAETVQSLLEKVKAMHQETPKVCPNITINKPMNINDIIPTPESLMIHSEARQKVFEQYRSEISRGLALLLALEDEPDV